MFGIDNINPLTALVAKLITTFVHLDKDENGKIDTSEWLAAAQFVFFQGLATVQNLDLSKLKQEIADLDKNEIAELINTFSMNHDLKDDELEAIIEDGLNLLAEMSNFVQRVGNWRKKRINEGATIIPMRRVAVATELARMHTPVVAKAAG